MNWFDKYRKIWLKRHKDKIKVTTEYYRGIISIRTLGKKFKQIDKE